MASEPEPVAWRKLWEGETEYTYYWMNRYQGSEPLYTVPPQREWQGLTDEEAKREFEKHNCVISADLAGILARAIEQASRRKNGNL